MIFTSQYYEAETREGFFIEEKMKRAWAAQIDVLEEIRRLCNKHSLRFFADWGSLLGAVRHHGYVPWDDDLDIGMPREDYMLFLDIAERELNPEFEIKSLYNDPTHDNVKARVITGRHMNFDKDYLLRFHACPYVVGIDIFPLDYIPRDKSKSDNQNKKIQLAMSAASSISPTPPYTKDEIRMVKELEKMSGFTVDYNNNLFHEIKKIVDELSALYTADESDEMCSMIDFALGWDYHAKKEWYAASTDEPFEYTTIPVPVGYDGLLKIKYGNDYMTPRQGASSHDYPFYKVQEEGLKEVMEAEFQVKLTQEQMDMLIAQRIQMALAEH